MVSFKNLFTFALFNSYILKCLASQNVSPTVPNPNPNAPPAPPPPAIPGMPSGTVIAPQQQPKTPMEKLIDEANNCTVDFKAATILPSTKAQLPVQDKVKFRDVFGAVGAADLNTVGLIQHIFGSASIQNKDKGAYGNTFLELRKAMECCTATKEELAFYNSFLQGGQFNNQPFANSFLLESMASDNFMAVALFNIKRTITTFQGLLKLIGERRLAFFQEVVGATDMSQHTGREFTDSAFYHNSMHVISYLERCLEGLNHNLTAMTEFREVKQPKARAALFDASPQAANVLGELVPTYSPHSAKLYQSSVKQNESQRQTTTSELVDEDDFNENFDGLYVGSPERSRSPSSGFGYQAGGDDLFQ